MYAKFTKDKTESSFKTWNGLARNMFMAQYKLTNQFSKEQTIIQKIHRSNRSPPSSSSEFLQYVTVHLVWLAL